MKLILEHKKLKDKYLVTSNSNSYAVYKVYLDENDEPKLDKNGNIKINSASGTYPTNVEYLLDGLYQRILRDNECVSLNDFYEHIVETKGIIRDFADRISLGDMNE